MACCVPYMVPFSNVSMTTVDYNTGLKELYGAYPKVTVYYYDQEANEYYEANGIPGSEVKFDGNTISVDHGGPATGQIKIQ